MTVKGIKHTYPECGTFNRTINLFSLSSQWDGRDRERAVLYLINLRDIATKCKVCIGS